MPRSFVVAVCLALGMCGFLPLATAVGPQLEDVPAPSVSGSLPAPATWPLLRHDRTLRALVITSKGRPLAGYQRICRRLNARLEARYTNAGDARYHVNDKWIEPQGDPTDAELTAYCRQLILDAIPSGAGRLSYGVIFYDHVARLLADTDLQKKLLAFVEAGGVLVVNGSEYPAAEGPLAPVWPAKATPHNSWMSGGAKRSAEPELAGIPLERLTGHTWIPLAEPANGGRALATGESGAMFVRAVGRGTVLFVPTGPLSRLWELHAKLGRTLDHDEIWLRVWDQVLHTLLGRPQAIPAYAELRTESPAGAAGQAFKFTARVSNRTATGPLVASLHVTTPQGHVVHQREFPINVPAGHDQSWELSVPVPSSWAAGLYPVYLTLGDGAAKKQLHQALEFLPVAGAVRLRLTSDKLGYRLGEAAQFVLSATSDEPWEGQLLFGIYDFRGRRLADQERPARLSAQSTDVAFTWRLADHGVRVDTFRAVVAAVKDGNTHARSEVKFYKHEPWSMRNEYQWSTWAGIACGSPCAIPSGMRLMAHAGMNALGYSGQSELFYAAERWGWRYYNEGLGMNTFSPVIEYENDAEIEAQMSKEAQGRGNSPDLTSAAFVLGSVGEEAGYKNGWGTRYYWDAPVAPEKACRAFQWYLKTKYGELDRLNATWRTRYRSWDQVKLTREFSGAAPKLEADGWAHPRASPLGADVTAVSLAPYSDTEYFYAWYYDRIIAAAKRIFRERLNPVTVTMASAPASWVFNSRECDVRLAGPSAWNESQMHALSDGPEPAFGLVWGHFDWSVKTENLFWGFLLQRCGHNNYWVDVPLMFNNDMSHTRASLALRRWTTRLAGHERLILDSRPAPSDVGVLAHNGISPNATPGNMDTSLRVALQQSGYGFAVADPAELGRYKIVFAPARQSVSRVEAERIHAFVAGGGTFVFTARFANQDAFGATQPVCPGEGLAAQWGFMVTEKTDAIPQYGHDRHTTVRLDGVGANGSGVFFGQRPDENAQRSAEKDLPPPLRDCVLAGRDVYRERIRADGWTRLASYDDQTPAVLAKTLGSGRLVYLNAIYQSHWYIQWVTPTGPERQGFFKLVEWLCDQAGAQRALRLDGELDQLLHLAVKQCIDPTGAIRYVMLRTSGEVPWTTGTLRWVGAGDAVYDVLSGSVGGPSRRVGREVPFNFRPGDGKLLAVLAAPLTTIRVTADPARLVPGQAVRLAVDLVDEQGRPVPGQFPLELRVTANGHEIPGLRRSFSLASGGTYTIQTALSEVDPVCRTGPDLPRRSGATSPRIDTTDGNPGIPSDSESSGNAPQVPSGGRDLQGPWTWTVTDGIAGRSGNTTVEVPATTPTAGPGFVPLGWPSEDEEPAQLTDTEFLDRLRHLATVYQTDHSDQGWKTKQILGAYYDFFPGTRHSLLRPLYDVDWTTYVEAWRTAIDAGSTFILTGEDVNLDPATGLSIWPHGSSRQLTAVAAVLRDAQWRLATADGETLVATLGAGRLILCRESVDAAGHTNPDVARWQRRWLAELAATAGQGPILAALDEPALRRWWAGETPAANVPRTVTWFAGNQREVTLLVDPAKPLDSVFTLIVPPHGRVSALDFRIVSDGPETYTFDIGCDNTLDGEGTWTNPPAPLLASALGDWPATVERYLAWGTAQGGPTRDDNAWRCIPVRVRSRARGTLTLSQLRIECR